MSDSYHDDYESVAKTMLNLFCDSPLEYYHTYVTRQMPRRAVGKPAIAGQVLHAMCLEDKLLSDLVLPYPSSVLKSNGDLNGKSASALRDDHPGVTFLKQSECDEIRAVVDGVFKHPELGKLLASATDRERRIDATIEGIKCKCKPDILCDLGDRVVIYDLKFSECVDADSWRRACKRFRYWLQDSHYSACVEAAFGKPVLFRFCLIEVKFPFRVQWKYFDPASRETSRDVHRQKLIELGVCHETGDWSDRWESTCVLQPWDLSDTEREVEVQIQD